MSSDSSTAPPERRQQPEELSLRARPQPITRISRKAVIGAAAIVLLLIAGLIVVALKPPTWRAPNPNEFVNVDRKPISDGLAKLPSTYEGVRVDKQERGKGGPLPPGVPQLENATGPSEGDAERIDRERLARMAGQARESSVFFRLQAKTIAARADVQPSPIRQHCASRQPRRTATCHPRGAARF